MPRLFAALFLIVAVGCGDVDYGHNDTLDSHNPSARPAPGDPDPDTPGSRPGREPQPDEPGLGPGPGPEPEPVPGFSCERSPELQAARGYWLDDEELQHEVSENYVLDQQFHLCNGYDGQLTMLSVGDEGDNQVHTSFYASDETLAIWAFVRLDGEEGSPVGVWGQFLDVQVDGYSEGQVRLLTLNADGTAEHSYDEWAGDSGGGGFDGESFWHLEEGNWFDRVVITGGLEETLHFDGKGMWNKAMYRFN